MIRYTIKCIVLFGIRGVYVCFVVRGIRIILYNNMVSLESMLGFDY